MRTTSKGFWLKPIPEFLYGHGLKAVAIFSNTGFIGLKKALVKAKGGFTIIGPRTNVQLEDNLGAINIQLNQEHLTRLDDASAISLDCPHELNNSQQQVIKGNKLD